MLPHTVRFAPVADFQSDEYSFSAFDDRKQETDISISKKASTGERIPSLLLP
jgi:hypothetical protein